MARRLMITVDVEAQPARAERDHLDRLVWGRYPEGRAGIGEMMDIADRHNVKLTMFLDYCEVHLYGEALLDVGREIARRGHDLELHAHPDFLRPDFWSGLGLTPKTNLSLMGPEHAEPLAEFLCTSHEAACGSRALAFRGGGYRYSPALLDALARRGVLLDSSVNISRATQPFRLPPGGQFLWANGCLEVPVACVGRFRNKSGPLDCNFSSALFSKRGRLMEFLDRFHEERSEDAVAVLVLHSWSFLERPDGQQHFTRLNPARRELFDELLGLLAGKVEVVTASDLVACRGRLALAPPVDIFGRSAGARAVWAGAGTTHREQATVMQYVYTKAECPICGAAKERFTDMGGRRCPDCRSVERQRAFVVAYDQAVRHDFDVAGRRVFIVSPSMSELRFLQERGITGKTCVDIRPEFFSASDEDVLIADVCAMPQVASGSQEFVFASYLMPGVHDMNAALDEIARILAPEGAFFSIETLHPGVDLKEVTDPEVISSFYGKEILDKYKVGNFRVLGEEGYLKALSAHFSVRRYSGVDPITGTANIVHVCRPLSAAPKTDCGDEERFSRADAAYARYLAEHPGGSYAQFSVGNQLAYVQQGNLHPTLGKKTQKFENYWEAGSTDFEKIQGMLRLGEDAKIVDYGCGSLRIGKFLIKQQNPDCYFGMDVVTGFIDMGQEEIGEEILRQKRPRFGAIEAKTLDDAAAFGADVVLSTACAFQIHPDEKGKFIADVKRLAGKDGSIVCFDTKIGPRPMRFKPSSWVWTLDYYEKAMAPMVLLERHKISDHTFQGQAFEGLFLVFGHKGGRRGTPVEHENNPGSPAPAPATPKPSLSALRSAALNASFARVLDERVRPKLGNLGRSLALLPHAKLSEAHKRTLGDLVRLLPATIGSWMDLGTPELAVRAAAFGGSEPESADLIVSVSLLDFLADHQAVIEGAARVLRPGGMALFHLKHARLQPGNTPPMVDYMVDPRSVGLPTGASMPSTKVGRSWLLLALSRAGLEVEHFEHRCEICLETFDWFIGRKPDGKAAGDGTPKAVAGGAPVAESQLANTGAPALAAASADPAKAKACVLCGADLAASLAAGDSNCPQCKSAPRTRTLTQLAGRLVGLLDPLGAAQERTLLAFGMDGPETKVQTTLFGHIRSASLYGTYYKDHETGVDVRDLSRYPEAGFDAVSGILLFDYFEEHGQALREIFRVLKPGGVFLTHISPFRLFSDLAAEPKKTSIIKKRKGYFDYVPDDAEMPSVNVGRDWFLSEMIRTGFEAQYVEHVDAPSGQAVGWFLGVKPLRQSVARPGIVNGMPASETRSPRPAWLESKCVHHVYFRFPKGNLYYYRNVRSGYASVLEAIDAQALRHNEYTKSLSEDLAAVRGRFGIYDEQCVAADALTFSIIRSPFRRLAAVYAYGIGLGNFYLPGKAEQPRYAHFGFSAETDFADFVRAIVTIPPEVSDDYVTPQAHRLFHDRGKRAKFIARLESIGEDWAVLMRLYGSDKRLPHRNRTDVRKDYWTEELRRLVYDYYYDDFRIFGYDPRGLETIEVRQEAPRPVRVADTHFEDSFAEQCGRAFVEDNEEVRRAAQPKPTAVRLQTMVSEAKSCEAPPQQKEYATPVPPETGYSLVTLTLSVPSVPHEMENMCFAEHAVDPVTGEASGQVILCGEGALGVSEDSGRTWRKVTASCLSGHWLWNCFTRIDGGHIVQALGWQGPGDTVLDQGKHAALFVFDKDWQLEGQAQPGTANWHGSASIGQACDTIMFAEYHANTERYAADFEARREEILPQLRSNAVLRSRDGGLTWEKVFERGPLEVRHFHTLQPDRFTPRRWWLSSGDKTEETHVWRSDDDGDTWLDVTNPEPDASVSSSSSVDRRTCQRFTDLVVDEDNLLWGADDLMGHRGAANYDFSLGKPGGARLYTSPKGDMLHPHEIGFIGQPVRSIIDVGPGWIILTEAKEISVGRRPEVFLLFKQPRRLVRLLDVDNYRNHGTGFSFSRASRKAKDGEFFCFRSISDAFRGGVRALKWRIEFE